jgi:hypothetical protein
LKDDDVLAAGLLVLVPQAANTTASTATAASPRPRLDAFLNLDISFLRGSP